MALPRIVAQASIDVATDLVQPGAFGFDVDALNVVTPGGRWQLPLDDDAQAAEGERQVLVALGGDSAVARAAVGGFVLGSPQTIDAQLLNQAAGVVFNSAARKAVDGNAADSSNIMLWAAPVDCIVQAVDILPDAALVADDANRAMMDILSAAPAGGPPTLVAALETSTVGNGGTGDWVKGQTVPFVMEASPNDELSAGDVVQIIVSKAGTGVIVPAMSVVIRARRAAGEVEPATSGLVTITVLTLGAR